MKQYSEEDLQEKLNRRQLEGIGERLEEDIAGILNRAGIYFRVFNRVKTPFSIVRKLEKEGYGFAEGEKKLQDIIGLRVVLYYQDDMSIVRTVLDKTFRCAGEWSETESTDIEFKASKLNGVFYIPEEYRRLYRGDFDGYPIDFTFEVQLRTVSFEGWHEIEHDMRYKSPYGNEFWKNNEDLSRALNCVLANLELCDWSTLNVFNKLSYYHFQEGNWEMMIKGKFRLRFDRQPLSEELKVFFDENKEVAYNFFRCERADVIFALMRLADDEPVTYDLVVRASNEVMTGCDSKQQRRLSKICCDLIKNKKEKKKLEEKKGQRLVPLEVTPTFRLNVVLTHDESKDIDEDFLAAVRLIGQWVQNCLCDVADDIPMEPVDYERYEPGYRVTILGNHSLGFYKMSLDHVDMSRIGVIWRTNVSLERSDRVRMKVDCNYCHTPDRLVRGSFSKPRFVDEIFRKIGYEDVIPMSLKPKKIRNMKEMERTSQFIANSNRTLPVILVAEEDKECQINVNRLTETIGTYAHVFLLEKKMIPLLVEHSDYTIEDIVGAVWVTFRGGEDKFFTKKMVEDSRFDFNKYAFEEGDVSEKAFRHKLVRMIKEKNCEVFC